MKKVIALLMVAAMTVGIAGCGSKQNQGETPPGETVQGEASGDGVSGGKSELVVVTSTEPVYFNNLCPSMTNLPDTLVYSQIYDPLFYKDWSDGGAVKGYLAESYEMSADGL